jgi:hypothetical protein
VSTYVSCRSLAEPRHAPSMIPLTVALCHAAPAHFHCSRVGETHEVLRRSFSSLRRMVLQRVKRGIEAKIKPMRSYAETISPGRLGRHQQYGQDDL